MTNDEGRMWIAEIRNGLSLGEEIGRTPGRCWSMFDGAYVHGEVLWSGEDEISRVLRFVAGNCYRSSPDRPRQAAPDRAAREIR